MLNFLRKSFFPSQRSKKQYDKEKEIAKTGSEKSRLSLARNSRTHQEILYYLAEKDPSAKVREAVARNKATPVHAGTILASDEDVDVRMALAGRLVGLLPELSHDRHSQLYAYTVQALATLALDEVLKVRKALASTLKDHAHAPPKIAGQLARDIEREVAEPILRFCAALEDSDLLDIIKTHPAGWAVEVIAQRDIVSAPVSEAVIDSGNVSAGTFLIENKGAQITPALLEHIVERAREYPEWHESIVTHQVLPPKMAKKLAGFVDEKVRETLLVNGRFDAETTEEIAEVVRRRIEFEGAEKRSGGSAIERVRRLAEEGGLEEAAISDALAMRDHEFVIVALAALAGTGAANIRKVFDMKTPKGICAVCWKAGLSMRMALRLQQEIGKIPSKELIYPKGGTDYPLSKEDMNWQIDFLGLDAA
ncbi:MAG: DUF2336 domain-containing protein [Rhodospirillales bacterium]|nr:DUF2336 domain-containing protein [Alphaproteobacteria bacterium]USO04496.1 MAG: DUF2336 domain-containing protein [Rhodospirillales bacterium]